MGSCDGAVEGDQSGTELGNDGRIVGYFDAGDWLMYRDIELTGANVVQVGYATEGSGTVELRVDAVDGPIIGVWEVTSTGDWGNWKLAPVPIEPTDGAHDLYLVGATGSGIANLEWYRAITCEPDCDGKTCGSDGCGGSCGTCEGTDYCVDDVCTACEPDCEGKSCGDDTCGGTCGAPCEAGQVCSADRECVDAVTLGAPGRIRVEGATLVDENGEVVVLRGVSLIDLGAQTTQRDGVPAVIDRITGEAWNNEIVRLPVYTDGPSPFSVYDPVERERYMREILRPAVDYATGKGLQVIVDFHQISDVTPEKDQLTRDFWAYMAPQFAEYPNVMYEVYNEPIDSEWNCVIGVNDDCWHTFKEKADVWVDIIRESAPDTLILVGGPSWSQVIGPAADAPIDDANVAYVGHVYPFNPVGHVEDQIRRAAAVHPVVLTEWGFGFEEGDQEPYATQIRELADELELSFTAWVADHQWGPPMFEPNGGLTPFGEFVQTWLAESTER